MIFHKVSPPYPVYLIKPTRIKKDEATGTMETDHRIEIRFLPNEFGDFVYDSEKASERLAEVEAAQGKIAMGERSIEKRKGELQKIIENKLFRHEDFKNGKIVEYVPKDVREKDADNKMLMEKYGISLDEVLEMKKDDQGTDQGESAETAGQVG